jgi:hypothetical protein
MRRSLIALFLCLAPSLAWGQGSLLQGGPWTPGHVPQYVGQGSGQAIVIDGGAASGGAIGANASEFGIVARGTGTAPYSGQGTGPFGSIGCLYDAPTTNPTGYHFLCLSPNATGGNALISYGAGGIATPGALNLNINGVAVPVTLGGYTIGSLPTCSGPTIGTRAYVTNGQTSPTFLGAVSATGAVVAPVFCNGSAWVYG